MNSLTADIQFARVLRNILELFLHCNSHPLTVKSQSQQKKKQTASTRFCQPFQESSRFKEFKEFNSHWFLWDDAIQHLGCGFCRFPGAVHDDFGTYQSIGDVFNLTHLGLIRVLFEEISLECQVILGCSFGGCFVMLWWLCLLRNESDCHCLFRE